MAILPIRIYGDPVLRKKYEPITEITPELRQLAKDMLETMYDAPGCGLAAPQIGKNIRLVVIDTAIPDEEEPRPYIMFNPEWEAEPDAKNVDYDEGCLSLPEIFCNVVRPDRVTVRFFDINGEAQEIHNCEGLFARCIQHETDRPVFRIVHHAGQHDTEIEFHPFSDNERTQVILAGHIDGRVIIVLHVFVVASGKGEQRQRKQEYLFHLFHSVKSLGWLNSHTYCLDQLLHPSFWTSPAARCMSTYGMGR